MALDGETNLKSKHAPSALRDCHNIEGLKSQNAEFILEDANRDLYDFNDKAILDGESFPLTLSNVVLRGSVIRNAAIAIGMVINTGEECKIRMNAQPPPESEEAATGSVYQSGRPRINYLHYCLLRRVLNQLFALGGAYRTKRLVSEQGLCSLQADHKWVYDNVQKRHSIGALRQFGNCQDWTNVDGCQRCEDV
jgi:hypothetical protein